MRNAVFPSVTRCRDGCDYWGTNGKWFTPSTVCMLLGCNVSSAAFHCCPWKMNVYSALILWIFCAEYWGFERKRQSERWTSAGDERKRISTCCIDLPATLNTRSRHFNVEVNFRGANALHEAAALSACISVPVRSASCSNNDVGRWKKRVSKTVSPRQKNNALKVNTI